MCLRSDRRGALIRVRYALFLAFLVFCLQACEHRVKTLAVQPFNGCDAALVDTIAATLVEIYGLPVLTLKPSPMPDGSFINVKSPRYRADKIIADLKARLPDSIDHVLGFTHFDISTTKRDENGNVKDPAYKYEDWGVFGLGYRPGASCVVSTFRLKHANKQHFIDRVKKVAVHEIGHNLGLPHCPNTECVMQDAAESISTIDGVELKLCEACKKMLL
jgi:archaemetzincin